MARGGAGRFRLVNIVVSTAALEKPRGRHDGKRE